MFSQILLNFKIICWINCLQKKAKFWLKNWDCRAVQKIALCRSRRELSNACPFFLNLLFEQDSYSNAYLLPNLASIQPRTSRCRRGCHVDERQSEKKESTYYNAMASKAWASLKNKFTRISSLQDLCSIERKKSDWTNRIDAWKGQAVSQLQSQ